MTRKRTLFFIKISSSSELNTKPMRADTSSSGLFQFSVEKVYSVRYLTPNRTHSDVIRRTVSTPAWCPKLRSLPRSAAQRPLPSIMMATCVGIRFMSSSLFIVVFVVILLFNIIMTRSTLGLETVSKRYQQCRIAIGVLEQSAAFDEIGINHTVEFVTQREVRRPLQT